ncbi:MAG: pyridoxal-5-phosphate-dependent protein subunit beta, partial [Blastocatellia bacterium]
MRAAGVSPSIIESVALPHLVQMENNLYGASFFLMKLLPARFVLDRARDEKLLEPSQVVIETTSGTFGLALAMLCN